MIGWMTLATLNWTVLLPLAQAAPQAPASQPYDQTRAMIFFFVAVVVAMYFILLRPQSREKRQREEMLNTLSKGDRVVTIGGIHGTVEAIDVSKGVVSLTIAPKTTIQVNKAAVHAVVKGKSGAGKDEKEAAAGEK